MPESDHLQYEARIIDQAIQGDKQAFGQLYEIYADRIFRYLSFRACSLVVAEDLMSEVFLKAWDALPRFGSKKNDNHFNAWLYKIAHNALVDHHRTTRHEVSLERIGDIASGVEKPELTVEKHEESVKLIRLMKMLDEISRNILINRFVAGLSHRETAEMLGLSENHVRVLQFRAIKKMRELMGDKHEII
jgi:RNA polymerase sigma-70 factor (ECF subfamily)